MSGRLRAVLAVIGFGALNIAATHFHAATIALFSGFLFGWFAFEAMFGDD